MSPASAHAYVETVLESINRYPLWQSEDLYRTNFGRLVAFISPIRAYSLPEAFDAQLGTAGSFKVWKVIHENMESIKRLDRRSVLSPDGVTSDLYQIRLAKIRHHFMHG